MVVTFNTPSPRIGITIWIILNDTSNLLYLGRSLLRYFWLFISRDLKEERKSGSSRSRNKLKDERRDSKDHDKRDGKDEKDDEAFDPSNLDKVQLLNNSSYVWIFSHPHCNFIIFTLIQFVTQISIFEKNSPQAPSDRYWELSLFNLTYFFLYLPINYLIFWQEGEQKRLEEEMQKRRERIERWRAERKKKELDLTKKEIKGNLLGKE